MLANTYLQRHGPTIHGGPGGLQGPSCTKRDGGPGCCGARVEPNDFEPFSGRRVLVIVDAEGAEIDVLQPGLPPALADMAIIVETHNVYRPGALDTMVSRFSLTHDIVRVDEGPKAHDPPAWLKRLAELDKMIAVWE